MGAWGYGYKDNDDYYNDGVDFVQPLIADLESKLKDKHKEVFNPDGTKIESEYGYDIVFSLFRSQLVWTSKILSTTDEIVSLTDANIKVIQDSINLIREVLPADSIDARDADKCIQVVTAEMDEVQNWIDGFTKTGGFPGDRIGAILEANSN